MKTNNLKQQAIELAYGEYWEQVKDFVDENGWCDYDYWFKFIGHKIDYDYKELNSLKMRPKSLAGIETNNEWIRIDSEKDLPEQGGEYHVVIKGKLDKAVYVKSNRWLVNGNDYPKTTQTHGISHYQPIIKPKPPIF